MFSLSENTSNVFLHAILIKNFKTQQSLVILDLPCLRKLTFVLGCHRFKKHRFSKCFFVHTETQCRRFQFPPVPRAFLSSSVFNYDRLEWTVVLPTEIKLRLNISPAGVSVDAAQRQPCGVYVNNSYLYCP